MFVYACPSSDLTKENPPMLLGITVISSFLAWYGLKIMNGICVGVSNISNNCRFQDLI